MKYTLDRFEGKKAVLLHRGNEAIEKILLKKQLPSDALEGDILELTFSKNGELLVAEVLKKETAKVREQAQTLLEKLRRKH